MNKNGMVIASHPEAAKAGIEILKNKGNAFDAAVAAGITVGVVDPANTSIGGYGGSLVAYVHESDKFISINFDSRAPAAASQDMFESIQQENGTVFVKNEANVFGPKSVGVPGILRGLEYALAKYGTKSISQVAAHAIKNAKKGFLVNKDTSMSIKEVLDHLTSEQFRETAKIIMPKGRIPKVGETLYFPDLARSLSIIADQGVDSFYDGELGEKIVDYLDACKGLLTLDDLKRYRPIESRPLKITYRDHEILTPPLCSGGISSLQILKIFEILSIGRKFKPGSAEFFHLMVEIMKSSWNERLSKYGDPEFISLNQEAQLSRKTIERLSGEVARTLKEPKHGSLISPSGASSTSHICVTDSEGNFVSMTHTLGGSLGSLVTVPGTGIIFGHGLSRFDPRPGLPNSVAPWKQPLHNMCPMLIIKDGKPVVAVGTPGGRTIVNNMSQFVIDLIDFRKSPRATLALPRCHVESIEPILLEKSAGKLVFSKLRRHGHEITSVKRIGGPAHIIMRQKDRFIGVTDPRGEGKVAS